MKSKLILTAVCFAAFTVSAMAQTSAGNVSAGQFGSNTGGGTYTFPGSVGIGAMFNVDPNGRLAISSNGQDSRYWIYVDQIVDTDTYSRGYSTARR